MADPATVFGVTLYNNARHLPEALESLLAQTDRDSAFLLLDDASSDETESMARGYAARDSRIRYVRHAERQGMVATWHEAFRRARQEWPSARYFAWASDHDRWHPEWLERQRAELEAHPDAVLAYPRSLRIDAEGEPLDKLPKTFETTGLGSTRARWLHFSSESAGAGDLVYGLIRVDAMENAGIFRRALQPDRLLMLELTLQGEFRQVPDVMWWRRTSGPSSITRQRATLFTDANRPAWLWMPPWLQHAFAISRTYVLHARPEIGRVAAARLVLRYMAFFLVRQYSKSTAFLHKWAQGLESLHQLYKIARSRTRWAIDDAKVAWFRWKGQTKRKWRRFVYDVAVARRRARAWIYERVEKFPTHVRRARRRIKQAIHEMLVATHQQRGRLRHMLKRGLYHTLVLTHRLGLRGRS